MREVKTRYIARWIAKQYHDENGEWEPDRDEYYSSRHPTLAEAQHWALEGSKSAGCVEWCQVTEEQFDDTLGIPYAHEAAWDVVRVLHGDWDGNWEEDRRL